MDAKFCLVCKSTPQRQYSIQNSVELRQKLCKVLKLPLDYVFKSNVLCLSCFILLDGISQLEAMKRTFLENFNTENDERPRPNQHCLANEAIHLISSQQTRATENESIPSTSRQHRQSTENEAVPKSTENEAVRQSIENEAVRQSTENEAVPQSTENEQVLSISRLERRQSSTGSYQAHAESLMEEDNTVWQSLMNEVLAIKNELYSLGEHISNGDEGNVKVESSDSNETQLTSDDIRNCPSLSLTKEEEHELNEIDEECSNDTAEGDPINQMNASSLDQTQNELNNTDFIDRMDMLLDETDGEIEIRENEENVRRDFENDVKSEVEENADQIRCNSPDVNMSERNSTLLAEVDEFVLSPSHNAEACRLSGQEDNSNSVSNPESDTSERCNSVKIWQIKFENDGKQAANKPVGSETNENIILILGKTPEKKSQHDASSHFTDSLQDKQKSPAHFTQTEVKFSSQNSPEDVAKSPTMTAEGVASLIKNAVCQQSNDERRNNPHSVGEIVDNQDIETVLSNGTLNYSPRTPIHRIEESTFYSKHECNTVEKIPQTNSQEDTVTVVDVFLNGSYVKEESNICKLSNSFEEDKILVKEGEYNGNNQEIGDLRNACKQSTSFEEEKEGDTQEIEVRNEEIEVRNACKEYTSFEEDKLLDKEGEYGDTQELEVRNSCEQSTSVEEDKLLEKEGEYGDTQELEVRNACKPSTSFEEDRVLEKEGEYGDTQEVRNACNFLENYLQSEENEQYQEHTPVVIKLQITDDSGEERSSLHLPTCLEPDVNANNISIISNDSSIDINLNEETVTHPSTPIASMEVERTRTPIAFMEVEKTFNLVKSPLVELVNEQVAKNLINSNTGINLNKETVHPHTPPQDVEKTSNLVKSPVKLVNGKTIAKNLIFSETDETEVQYLMNDIVNNICISNDISCTGTSQNEEIVQLNIPDTCKDADKTLDVVKSTNHTDEIVQPNIPKACEEVEKTPDVVKSTSHSEETVPPNTPAACEEVEKTINLVKSTNHTDEIVPPNTPKACEEIEKISNIVERSVESLLNGNVVARNLVFTKTENLIPSEKEDRKHSSKKDVKKRKAKHKKLGKSAKENVPAQEKQLSGGPVQEGSKCMEQRETESEKIAEFNSSSTKDAGEINKTEQESVDHLVQDKENSITYQGRNSTRKYVELVTISKKCQLVLPSDDSSFLKTPPKTLKRKSCEGGNRSRTNSCKKKATSKRSVKPNKVINFVESKSEEAVQPNPGNEDLSNKEDLSNSSDGVIKAVNSLISNVCNNVELEITPLDLSEHENKVENGAIEETETKNACNFLENFLQENEESEEHVAIEEPVNSDSRSCEEIRTLHLQDLITETCSDSMMVLATCATMLSDQNNRERNEELHSDEQSTLTTLVHESISQFIGENTMNAIIRDASHFEEPSILTVGNDTTMDKIFGFTEKQVEKDVSTVPIVDEEPTDLSQEEIPKQLESMNPEPQLSEDLPRIPSPDLPQEEVSKKPASPTLPDPILSQSPKSLDQNADSKIESSDHPTLLEDIEFSMNPEPQLSKDLPRIPSPDLPREEVSKRPASPTLPDPILSQSPKSLDQNADSKIENSDHPTPLEDIEFSNDTLTDIELPVNVTVSSCYTSLKKEHASGLTFKNRFQGNKRNSDDLAVQSNTKLAVHCRISEGRVEEQNPEPVEMTFSPIKLKEPEESTSSVTQVSVTIPVTTEVTNLILPKGPVGLGSSFIRPPEKGKILDQFPGINGVRANSRPSLIGRSQINTGTKTSTSNIEPSSIPVPSSAFRIPKRIYPNRASVKTSQNFTSQNGVQNSALPVLSLLNGQIPNAYLMQFNSVNNGLRVPLVNSTQSIVSPVLSTKVEHDKYLNQFKHNDLVPENVMGDGSHPKPENSNQIISQVSNLNPPDSVHLSDPQNVQLKTEPKLEEPLNLVSSGSVKTETSNTTKSTLGLRKGLVKAMSRIPGFKKPLTKETKAFKKSEHSKETLKQNIEKNADRTKLTSKTELKLNSKINPIPNTSKFTTVKKEEKNKFKKIATSKLPQTLQSRDRTTSSSNEATVSKRVLRSSSRGKSTEELAKGSYLPKLSNKTGPEAKRRPTQLRLPQVNKASPNAKTSKRRSPDVVKEEPNSEDILTSPDVKKQRLDTNFEKNEVIKCKILKDNKLIENQVPVKEEPCFKFSKSCLEEGYALLEVLDNLCQRM